MTDSLPTLADSPGRRYLTLCRTWWASNPPSSADRLFAQRVLFDSSIAWATDDGEC